MKAVDLFCGGGGLSYGLSSSGIEVVAAYDCWKPALDFYNKNIVGHNAYELNLSDVDASVKEISRWNPDIIVGGPPCQDFSSAGKMDENGCRASLTTAYAEIVTRIKPKMFLMENVERALKMKTYRDALSKFIDNGYDISVAVLDASLCGAPQARKRVVVVGGLGFRTSGIIDEYKRTQSDHRMTIREYVGDSFGVDYYYRHPRSYSRRGIFSIDEPSPTIRGVNRPIPKGYAGHPGDAAPMSTPGIRALTTKERGRIQTFPEEWNLIGSKSNVEQIVGNAVPCELGRFVGKAILNLAKSANESNLESSSKFIDVFIQGETPDLGKFNRVDL